MTTILKFLFTNELNWTVQENGRLTAYVENNQLKFKLKLSENSPSNTERVHYLAQEQIFGLGEVLSRDIFSNLGWRVTKSLLKDFEPTVIETEGQIHVEFKYSHQGVIILSITGKKINLPCEPSDTVSNIREMIRAKVKIPPQQQRLIYSGKQLEDSGELTHYQIKSGHIIYFAVRSPIVVKG